MTAEQAAIEVIQQLKIRGYIAYFVGGYIRDKLLYRVSTGDIDIATDALPEQVLEIFPDSKYVGESFGVVLVKMGEYSFEVATFRKDMGTTDGRHPANVEFTNNIHFDSDRRDFTINAIYHNPLNGEYFDEVDGQRDLKNEIIKFVGNPQKRIKEDYLRMLRAVRFAVKLGFTLDVVTKYAIIGNARHVTKLAPERIFDELNKIFKTTDVGKAFSLLEELGLLSAIFPDISRLRYVPEPPEFHPEGDTFTHTMQVLQNIPVGAPLRLTYAALLHDVGKPDTRGFNNNRITFYGHDEKSAELVEVILKNLKAPTKLIEDVVYLVRNHMVFRNVQTMKKSKLKKFMAHPLFFDSLQLHYADCMGAHKNLSNYNFLLRKMSETKIEEVKKEVENRLITGEDLLGAGFKSGPLFKVILDDVAEKYLEGNLKVYSDAMYYVHYKYGKYSRIL
jgi:poly(A) polymerase